MSIFYRVAALIVVAGLAMPPVAGASSASGAHAMVARTLAALGWKRNVRTLKSIRMSGEVVDYDVVENDHVGAPYYLRRVARETITDDLYNDRLLTMATNQATAFAASARSIRAVLSHDTQLIEIDAGGKRNSLRLEAPPNWEMHNPIWTLLLAERAPDLALRADTELHGAPQHVVAFRHNGCEVRILIDALTTLPSATETTFSLRRSSSQDVAWNAWGDLVERTEYINWRLRDGVRYPLQWDTFRNGALTGTLSISTVDFNVPVGNELFAMPDVKQPPTAQISVDDLKLGQPVAYAPDPHRAIAEIVPGIVQMPNSWYVTLVRQDDGIVVIDAPISAGYSKQVLAWAAHRWPGVPIKAVVTSTSFYWHIAGIREYATRGIPIYVRDRNVPIVRRLLSAPHVLVPDDLAHHPEKPVIHSVSSRTTIGHGKNAIVLWPIRYATQPMLMTYIPDAHLLHTAEMVQPLGPNGSILFPESLIELEASVQYAHIPTERLTMIGMHMSPTPWSAIGETLRAAEAKNHQDASAPQGPDSKEHTT
jgi:hypothetical protein